MFFWKCFSNCGFVSAIIGVIVGAGLTYLFTGWQERKRTRQNKINLLNFIKADIETLKNTFDNLMKSTPALQTVSETKKQLENIDSPIAEDFKSFISFLEQKQYLLVSVHSNFFAGFDNYISREIGSVSNDTAKKVIKFYYYAKTFCDTSKNYMESLENLNLNLKNFKESLKNLQNEKQLELYSFYLKDLESGLQLLNNLYEQTDEEKGKVMKVLEKSLQKL